MTLRSKVLVSFNGANGTIPAGPLIADANGDLFGVTAFGGATGNGTVFEITNTVTGYANALILWSASTAPTVTPRTAA